VTKEPDEDEESEVDEVLSCVVKERRMVRREESAISVSRWCISFCHLVTCSDAVMWIFLRSTAAHNSADGLVATSDTTLFITTPNASGVLVARWRF
jgi:hypothetical protein